MIRLVSIWAEDDFIIGTARACKGAGLIILRVAISIRAFTLEIPRVARSVTAPGRAAILIRLENGAWVVATVGGLQHGGALSVDVGVTCYATAATIGCRTKFHRNIKSIDQGYVEEVEVVELVKSEFGQGVGWCTVALASEDAVAVSGHTPLAADLVEAAAGPGPNTTSGCAGVHVEAPGLTRVEAPATTWHRSRPNRVGTAILDVENGGLGGGEEEEGEKEGGNGATHYEEDRLCCSSD